MEITYEKAQLMLHERLDEYPEIKALVMDRAFIETLAELLAFESIDPSLLSTIEREVLVVLTFYAPVSELPQNIAESTGISLEVSESLTTMIESILLSDFLDQLYSFDELWKVEFEKSAGIPPAPVAVNPPQAQPLVVPIAPPVQAVPQPEKVVPIIEHPPVPTPPTREEVVTKTETYTVPKSLTREEVLAALTPTRTMAGDIDTVAHTSADGVVHGYDAYQRIKNGL
jgi:hypothetical protein